MAKKSKEAEAARNAKTAKEEAIQRAVKMYQDRFEGPESSCLGLRTVCTMVEKEIKREAGIEVKINYETVRGRVNGTYKHS